MTHFTLSNAQLILPHTVERGSLVVRDGVIEALGNVVPQGEVIDLGGAYLSPGFVELHVHGGDGADFMDLTPEAFRTVARCHARHGTTTMTPTSTVGTFAEYKRFLEICAELQETNTGGARLVGGHLYGPYFRPEAKGCHPNRDFLAPEPGRDAELLAFAGRGLKTLTIAPELSGAEALARAAKERGLLVTAGHTYATFAQLEAARSWGVSHVDHLFCAMSDRARLRQFQAFPMQAGVMEATLFFDDITTEVIADGQHLNPDLLRFAYKSKGADKLALVTDSMRAVDCADGEYWFGATGTGERIRKQGNAGVTLDGQGLASGVMGMDHCLRTMLAATGAPLPDILRMATLTPARILGLDAECGSLAVGKLADLVVLNHELQVLNVYVGGKKPKPR
jgi:N-acetylglucosamine-6-phosphate deacetylase